MQGDQDLPVAIHCRGGLGRTGTAAVGLEMVKSNIKPAQAITILRHGRSPAMVQKQAQVHTLVQLERLLLERQGGEAIYELGTTAPVARTPGQGVVNRGFEPDEHPLPPLPQSRPAATEATRRSPSPLPQARPVPPVPSLAPLRQPVVMRTSDDFAAASNSHLSASLPPVDQPDSLQVRRPRESVLTSRADIIAALNAHFSASRPLVPRPDLPRQPAAAVEGLGNKPAVVPHRAVPTPVSSDSSAPVARPRPAPRQAWPEVS